MEDTREILQGLQDARVVRLHPGGLAQDGNLAQRRLKLRDAITRLAAAPIGVHALCADAIVKTLGS